MAKAGDGKDRSSRRRRHNLLQKRVSDAELAAFCKRAQDKGFADHREYMAALIRGHAEIERRDRQELIRALGELGKQASNINQIAHAINSGRVNTLAPENIEVIEEARAAIAGAAAVIRDALQ